MGIFSHTDNTPPPPLPPAPFAIGVFPAYTQHGNEVALKIREKKLSFTGDDFDINDAMTGFKVFHCNGKVVSLSGKKDFTDAQGQHLFTLKKEHLHIHSTYVGNDSNQNHLFTVKAALFGLGANLTVTFNNNAYNGQETIFEVKGDWFDRKAVITFNGSPVGRISRNFFNAGQLFFDRQTYILTVAPGVDAALLAAICVCLDEKENEQK